MPRRTAARKSSTPNKYYASGYSQNWVKWVVIYLLVGGLIYLAIYALFFQKGYYDSSGTGSSTQQNNLYP